METEPRTTFWLRKLAARSHSNASEGRSDVVSPTLDCMGKGRRSTIISTSNWFHVGKKRIIRHSEKFSKRARSLIAQMFLVSVVFVTNICLAIYANLRYPTSGAVGLIYEGRCSEVNALNLGLHFLISTLSMLMLSTSNYCMQLQMSPTRADVDEAHRDGNSVDIGLLTLRNMRYVRGWRRVSWAILAFTSLPINVL